MRKHPVRKFLGLTVLYAALIVGIFVIQFKAESVISESIGAMRITLAQTETPDGLQELKNTLQVSYKGITFSTTEDSPAMLNGADGSRTPLVLSSWTKGTSRVEFDFTDGSQIAFDVLDDQLYVTARPSDSSKSLSLPYKTTGALSVFERTDSRIVLSERSSYRSLSAPLLTADNIVFSGSESMASYSPFDPTKRFEFVTVDGVAGTESSAYDSLVKQLKTALVNTFTQVLSTAQAESLSEQEVIAYVAEMALNEKYDVALDAVPESFKRGNRRTYISSPYFDNLVNMNRSLSVQTEKFNSQVDQAIASQNLDIFSVDRIIDYILREKKTQRIETLLSFPSEQEAFGPTLSQATGIITVYCQLVSEGEERLASLLESTLPACERAIETSCSYDSEANVLTVTENERQVSVTQVFQTGHALMELGRIQNRSALLSAGTLLITQNAEALATFKLSQLAELYPIVVENDFYPHSTVLGYYGNTPVWTWTCAKSASYTITSDGTVDLRIEFPQGATHYVIVNGVPTFHANIEIQGMPFRTDPRFETYNSSGYVYQSDTQTLFLKSRHKSQVELIRLGCDPTTLFTYIDGSRP